MSVTSVTQCRAQCGAWSRVTHGARGQVGRTAAARSCSRRPRLHRHVEPPRVETDGAEAGSAHWSTGCWGGPVTPTTCRSAVRPPSTSLLPRSADGRTCVLLIGRPTGLRAGQRSARACTGPSYAHWALGPPLCGPRLRGCVCGSHTARGWWSRSCSLGGGRRELACV